MKKDANYNNVEDIEAKKAALLPANKISYNVGGFFLFSGLSSLIIYAIYIFKGDKIRKIYFLNKIFNAVPKYGVSFFLYFGIFALIIFGLMYFTLNKKVGFDHWVLDIAQKKLNSQAIYFTPKKILIGYDLTIKAKDIKDFIDELSDDSGKYTYYYNKTDIDRSLIFITPTKRKPLPTKSTIDIKTDVAWNIIPLGEVVNHEKKTITPICWYLNEETKRDDVLQTIPSTSILISGGTGSGKSVLQNCIIGHISRFPKNFNLFLGDIKKVEFGRLRNVQTVKQVGVELDQIEIILRTMREIMLDRYRMMERFGVNNIYDMVGKEVDMICINGIDYQEDDILNTKTAKPDGMKFELMAVKKIKDSIEASSKSISDANISVEISSKIFNKIETVELHVGKYFPKANVLMIDEMTEVMSGSNYKLVGSIGESISSIARLGRAAATHLALATQRPSGNIISSDLKNNIQQSVLLGLFDSGASTLIFDKDVSHLCKPKIKGRGFLKTGNDVVEFQSYWTTPKTDFIYISTIDKEPVADVKIEEKSKIEIVDNIDVNAEHIYHEQFKEVKKEEIIEEKQESMEPVEIHPKKFLNLNSQTNKENKINSDNMELINHIKSLDRKADHRLKLNTKDQEPNVTQRKTLKLNVGKGDKS